MTPTEAFDRARAEFHWPKTRRLQLGVGLVRGHCEKQRHSGIGHRQRGHGVTKVTFDSLAERSTRVARWLADKRRARGDKILVMLTNALPLWEMMLAA
jgi:acetyl-CoA synthetase